jgi:hypothetical protein
VRTPVRATEFIAPRLVRRYLVDAWEASPPVPGRGRSRAARPLFDYAATVALRGPTIQPKLAQLDVKWTWRAEVAPKSIFSARENPAEKSATCSHFTKWRGPESNRRHHDFQGGRGHRLSPTRSLHICAFHRAALKLWCPWMVVDSRWFGTTRGGLVPRREWPRCAWTSATCAVNGQRRDFGRDRARQDQHNRLQKRHGAVRPALRPRP